LSRLPQLGCLGLVLGAIVWAQGASSKHEGELKQAEDAWIKAITASDQGALEKVLHPRLVYTHSTGVVESKGEYIKAVSTFQKYTNVDYENFRVNVFGDTAVVNAKARMRGSTRGTPFDNQLLLIHVWVKEAGRWQLAAHQTTRLQ
jgi:ketosteroid isomerase-like protein